MLLCDRSGVFYLVCTIYTGGGGVRNTRRPTRALPSKFTRGSILLSTIAAATLCRLTDD